MALRFVAAVWIYLLHQVHATHTHTHTRRHTLPGMMAATRTHTHTHTYGHFAQASACAVGTGPYITTHVYCNRIGEHTGRIGLVDLLVVVVVVANIYGERATMPVCVCAEGERDATRKDLRAHACVHT